MTPYHEYFVPFFLLGFLIAGTASFVAGRMSGCVVPGVLLWIGVMVSWAALFIGSHLGYRAWQSMPDAPDEAFRDTSAAGALFLGWFPGLVFCLAVFGLVRGIRWALHWANPDADAEDGRAVSESVETGNPFQGPSSG